MKSMRRFSDCSRPLLVAHVIHRLAVGGLENGLINLINHMPHNRYHHVIICLAGSNDYSQRIKREDVPVITLNQKKGRDLKVHRRFLRALRMLRPEIVHTRNLSALEFQLVSALGRVPGQIHGEHGRDMYDLDGMNFKYIVLRKLMRPFIHRQVAVSQDLTEWLVDSVNVPRQYVTQIYNGVDRETFRPRTSTHTTLGPAGFVSSETFVVGTVARLEPVKEQLTLVRAFLHLLRDNPVLREHLRLVKGMVRSESKLCKCFATLRPNSSRGYLENETIFRYFACDGSICTSFPKRGDLQYYT